MHRPILHAIDPILFSAEEVQVIQEISIDKKKFVGKYMQRRWIHVAVQKMKHESVVDKRGGVGW